MLARGLGAPASAYAASMESEQGTTMKWTLQSAGPDRQLDKDDITFDGSMTVVQQPAPSSAKP